MNKKSSKQSLLEQKLALIKKQESDLSKKEADLLKQIEDEKNKNKPKNIMDLVKSYEDACKYKKVKSTLSYTNRNGRSINSIAHDRLEFTFSVLNEGHKFKMTADERRWYVWFYLDKSVPSGLRFLHTSYYDGHADAASAAHLCFKDEKLANHSVNCPEIMNDYGKFIIGK